MSEIALSIGIIPDAQGSTADDQTAWLIAAPPSLNQYRRFSTFDQRLDEMITTFNSEGVDLVVDVGDLTDASCGGSAQGGRTNAETYLQGTYDGRGAYQGVNDLTMPFLSVRGNHENGIWYESDSEEIADYLAIIDQKHVTRANEYSRSGYYSKHYTYDLNGYRFICIDTPLFDPVTHPTDEWFEDQLDASPYPVIVVSHVAPWEISELNAIWYRSDHDVIQPLIEASGKVECILTGHNHWGNGARYFSDIWGFNFFASVLCPNVDDNAYFIVDFIPNARKTPNGWKSNIRIRGYGSNGGKSSKPFDSMIL